MLGAPPAFILSQDRTLRSNQRANGPFIPCTGCRSVALSAGSECNIRIRLVKGTKGCYVAHFVTSTSLVCLVDLIDRSIRFSRFARAATARPVGPAGRGAGMKYTRPGVRPQGGGGISTGRTQLGRVVGSTRGGYCLCGVTYHPVFPLLRASLGDSAPKSCRDSASPNVHL